MLQQQIQTTLPPHQKLTQSMNPTRLHRSFPSQDPKLQSTSFLTNIPSQLMLLPTSTQDLIPPWWILRFFLLLHGNPLPITSKQLMEKYLQLIWFLQTRLVLRFFLSYTIWVHVMRTPLLDKDILIGWDVYCQCKSLRLLPTGIRYKKSSNHFQTFPKSSLCLKSGHHLNKSRENYFSFAPIVMLNSIIPIIYGKIQTSSSSSLSSSMKMLTLQKPPTLACHHQTSS